jgi:predicted adenylyl cyclase CyaB
VPQPRRNVELKAVDRDPQTTLAVALAAGARDLGVLVQRDTYFTVTSGRLKLREQEHDPAQLIAYERPDDPDVRLSRYHLIDVPDAATALAGLSATLGVRVVVAKRRQLLQSDNVRIHLDDVEGLGRFVELEAVAAPGADLQAERAKVERLRELLDLRPSDLRAGSYSDLLTPQPDAELLQLARDVANRAYAPYSHFHVGAALRTGNQSDPSNPTTAMDEAPVLNNSTTAATLNPSADLVVIRRVALIDKISAFVVQG